MVILLLIGIALAGVAVALLARAVAHPDLRGATPVVQIQRYGFSKRNRAERSKAALGIVDRAADSVGERFVGRWGKADEIRRQLVGAGMYGVTVNKFLGYRILAAAGLPLIWIWFAATSSLSG